MDDITEQRIKLLELQKEIAHTVIHRMSLWQKIWLWRSASYFRKQYDTACDKISKLRKESK
jgi:hypothetical protein